MYAHSNILAHECIIICVCIHCVCIMLRFYTCVCTHVCKYVYGCISCKDTFSIPKYGQLK